MNRVLAIAALVSAPSLCFAATEHFQASLNRRQ